MTAIISVASERETDVNANRPAKLYRVNSLVICIRIHLLEKLLTSYHIMTLTFHQFAQKLGRVFNSCRIPGVIRSRDAFDMHYLLE